MSPELTLLRAPVRGYARLVENTRPVGAWAALRRPALAALILGVAAAASATGHVPARLVASATLCWSVVILLQVAIALVVIGPAARRGVGVARALDLFFMAHAPWSLWALGFAAWTILTSPIGQPIRYAQFTTVVPLAWTAAQIYAFHAQVLRCDRRAALRRTVLHQAITWGVAILLLGNSVWPRVVGAWERWFAA